MEAQIQTENRRKPRRGPDSSARPLYMFGKAIEAIKEAVRLEAYAGELTQLRLGGESLRGICPIHGGENRSSFAVYPEKQRWFCYRGNEGGDIVDLCQAVENHSTAWTAMLSLAQRYGIELPRRSECWHKWQSQKGDVRARVLEAITLSYQRRFFRVYASFLSDIEDPTAREEEAASFWETCGAVARMCAAGRVGR